MDKIPEEVIAYIQMHPPLILLTLQFMDWLAGTAAAWQTKSVNSSVGFKGANKKALQWFIISACYIVAKYAPQVPLPSIVCVFYILAEFVSLLKNCAIAGVKLPSALVNVMSEFKDAALSPNASKRLRKRAIKAGVIEDTETESEEVAPQEADKP